MRFIPVTAEEVKAAVLNNAITQLLHHECGICGVHTRYLFDILNKVAYYDSSCGCSESYPRLSSFADVAEFINMQTNLTVATKLRDGLHLPPPHVIREEAQLSQEQTPPEQNQ